MVLFADVLHKVVVKFVLKLTIQWKLFIEQFFLVALLVILLRVVLTFESLDESKRVPECDHSK